MAHREERKRHERGIADRQFAVVQETVVASLAGLSRCDRAGAQRKNEFPLRRYISLKNRHQAARLEAFDKETPGEESFRAFRLRRDVKENKALARQTLQALPLLLRM